MTRTIVLVSLLAFVFDMAQCARLEAAQLVTTEEDDLIVEEHAENAHGLISAHKQIAVDTVKQNASADEHELKKSGEEIGLNQSQELGGCGFFKSCKKRFRNYPKMSCAPDSMGYQIPFDCAHGDVKVKMCSWMTWSSGIAVMVEGGDGDGALLLPEVTNRQDSD